jgi:hypothetical protein
VTSQIWSAVLAAGQEWAAAPVPVSYSAPWRSAYAPRARGLALWAQHVLARYGTLAQEPMLTGFRAALIARPVQHGELLESAEGRAWQESAQRARAAITLLAAALRSELPGMPMLPVPHVVQGSPWTTRDYTLRVPWPRELRTGAGRTDPILIRAAQVLEAPVRAMRLGVLPSPSLAGLRGALAAEPLRTKAEDQLGALSAKDRANLSELSRELRMRLTQDAVTRTAGDDPADRLRLREQLVARALLDERFGSRLSAWRETFSLLDNALRVLQQIVVFGGALALPGEVREADFRADGSGTRARIVLNTENPFAVRSGWAVLVNAAAVPDAIVVESLSANQPVNGEPWRMVVEGPLLADSGTVLRSSAVPGELPAPSSPKRRSRGLSSRTSPTFVNSDILPGLRKPGGAST